MVTYFANLLSFEDPFELNSYPFIIMLFFVSWTLFVVCYFCAVERPNKVLYIIAYSYATLSPFSRQLCTRLSCNFVSHFYKALSLKLKKLTDFKNTKKNELTLLPPPDCRSLSMRLGNLIF